MTGVAGEVQQKTRDRHRRVACRYLKQSKRVQELLLTASLARIRPWKSELFLAFQDISSLELDFQMEFHRCRCKYDIVWSAVMFLSGAAAVYRSQFNRSSYVAVVLQFLYLTSWLAPYWLQIFLPPRRYAALRTTFHIVHYVMYILFIASMSVLTISANAPMLYCEVVHTYVSIIVLHPVNAWMGRQLLFKELLPMLVVAAPMWGYIFFRRGGVCEVAMACRVPRVISTICYFLDILTFPKYTGGVLERAMDSKYRNTLFRGHIGVVSFLVFVSCSFMCGLFAYWLERRQRDLFLKARRIPHISFHGLDFLLESLLLCAVFFYILILMFLL